MVTLGTLDAVIILVYIAALLALGFSAKLRDSSVLQFLVAGRNLTLAPFVATLVCTWYGGILGMGESVSYYGVGTLLLLGVPYYIFALTYAFFLAKRVRGAEEISIPERLSRTFGRSAGLMGAFLIFLLAVPSAHVLMLGILVQLFTGWNLLASVVIAAIGGAAFLFKGGLLADVRASLLAFVMMYMGFIVIVIVCVQRLPLPAAIATLPAPSQTWTGGQNWAVILTFLILGAWTLIDPGFHQRVASAQSPEIGKKGVLVSVGFWILFDLLSITTGIYAMSFLTESPSNLLMVFPLLGEMVLPAGLKALFFCGMFGTIMCAMVGYTLVSGATFGREVVAVLRPNLKDQEIKTWTRIGLALGIALAIIIGTNVGSVVLLWYNWGGLVTGALLIPVLLAYLRPNTPINKAWIIGSMVVAFLTSLIWWISQTRIGNDFLLITINENEIGIGTLLPALGISAIILGLGSLFSTREKEHGNRG